MRLLPKLMWAFDGAAHEPVDARLLPLLAAIAATGSLSAAVAARGLSYRAAWGLLRTYEHRLGAPLVEFRRGRGAELSDAGTNLVDAQRRAEQKLARVLPMLGVDFGDSTASRGRGTPTLSIAASHDLVLAALRELSTNALQVKLDVSFMGSLHALEQFAEARVNAAGFHVALGAREENATPCKSRGNKARALAPFRRWLDPHRDQLVCFVEREQGLILAHGNPARVRNFRDIAAKRLRFINRQAGSGTRLLIEGLLAQERVSPTAFEGFSQEEFTHSAVAATVASGAADAGFGLRAAAAGSGLAFVPLARERYYLVVRASEIDTPGIVSLLLMLRSPAFVRLARRYPGYAPVRAGELAGVAALGRV
jgi:putative molybdopterin biosynthesis protein